MGRDNEFLQVDLFTLFVSLPVTIWWVKKKKIPKELLWLHLLWSTHVTLKIYRK